MNHKYFPTKEDLNIWIKENTAVEITDIVKLETGLYIKYLQLHAKNRKKEQKRNRLWSVNMYH